MTFMISGGRAKERYNLMNGENVILVIMTIRTFFAEKSLMKNDQDQIFKLTQRGGGSGGKR